MCVNFGCFAARLAPNVLQLGEVADFTINVDAENQTLINHKCVCGAHCLQFLLGAVRQR